MMVFAPELMPELGDVAVRHPSLRIVLEHLCIDSKLRDDGFVNRWMQ